MALIVSATALTLLYLGKTEIVKLLSSPLISLIGTLIAAYVAFHIANHQTSLQTEASRRSHCLDLTFDLHKEFSAPVMLDARADADKLTAKYFGMSYSSLYEALPAQSTRCLFLVTDFYERLAISLDKNRLDTQLVPELFGPLFIWWYINCFQVLIIKESPDWHLTENLKRLHAWMKLHTPKDDMKKWEDRATADLKKRDVDHASFIHPTPRNGIEEVR